MSNTPEELKTTEAAFAALAPSVGTLNRDRLLYEAGRTAGPRRVGWPVATSLLAGLSAILAVQLATRVEPAVRTVEVVRYVTPSEGQAAEAKRELVVSSSEPALANARLSPSSYLSLRDRVLRFDTDALPALPPVADSAAPLEVIERGFESKSFPG